jgi:glycosyltransferase involved in cell wall biosynthesis
MVVNPRVSVVIPTRNRPELVLRAVHSALGQTYKNLEIVVVVDGPDAQTVRALVDLGEPAVRICHLAESVGGAEARNEGVRAATGEWIAFLDDDDEWLPTKIEKQVKAAVQSDNPLAIVTCKIVLRGGGSDSVVPHKLPKPGQPISEYVLGAPRNGFQTSSYFVSRALMLFVPWTKNLKGLQDFDWFLRGTTYPGATLTVLPEPLSIYYVESVNTITRKLSWLTCYEWGQQNRSLMTPRAYSCFLSRVCANRARAQNAGVRVLLKLFFEMLFDGRPDMLSIAMFFGYVTMPYESRRTIGNWISRLFAPEATSAAAV